MENKKQRNRNTSFAAEQVGSHLSYDVQAGSQEAMKGMELFKNITKEKMNVNFELKKGNLFEFIEAAKFNQEQGNLGKGIRAEVTHAIGEPHAPDDIRLMENGSIIDRVQAKVNDLSPKGNKAAAVRIISDPKYKGMQRNVPLGNKEPMEELMDKRIGNGNIYEDDYRDARKNLTDRLTDRRDGTGSKGTTIDELREASDNPNRYAIKFEAKQYAREVGATTANMAAASAVVSGVVSSVSNLWDVYQDKKQLGQALKDIGKDSAKGLARGGVTGFLSSVFRIGGQKSGMVLLADSSVATVLAGGILDTGLAVYSYAKGEIDSKELKESLENTAVKSVSTVYFTKAVEFAFGKAAGPFLPIAVYTLASYVVTTCREIIKEAKLNAAEYDRIAALYNESTKQLKEQKLILEQMLNQYVSAKKDTLFHFLNSFETDLSSGKNYDNAVLAISTFATKFGFSLQHADFGDFSRAMNSKEDFVLK